MAHYLILLLASVYSLALHAGVLRDPTMPPAQWMPASAAEANATNTPVLQSVKLGADQKAAMINGQWVPLGQHFQQSKLVKLTESEAVLLAADGSRKVLTMQFSITRLPADNRQQGIKPKMKNKREGI